jgi:hypothetical protein
MAKDKPHDWKDIETKIDGTTVKGGYYVEGDDLVAATRYSMMMLRHASCEKGYGFNRKLEIPRPGIV